MKYLTLVLCTALAIAICMAGCAQIRRLNQAFILPPMPTHSISGCPELSLVCESDLVRDWSKCWCDYD